MFIQKEFGHYTQTDRTVNRCICLPPISVSHSQQVRTQALTVHVSTVVPSHSNLRLTAHTNPRRGVIHPALVRSYFPADTEQPATRKKKSTAPTQECAAAVQNTV